jgi:hypothetical protein
MNNEYKIKKFSNISKFISADVIKFLNVSRQQINSIIKGLISKGKIVYK